MSAADRILDIELPPRPAVLQHLGLEMQKEEPDFMRVSELVNSDVGLGAAMIKIANSPYVGLGRRIASVQQAILYLGLAEVFGVITGLLLRRSFGCADPAMDRLWETAARRAALMSWLARQAPGVSSDRAYTCGLFEDCGMAVLLLHAPGYADTLTLVEAAPNPQELERAHHGLDHVVLSQALVRAWGLPDSIAIAVRHHHDGMALDQLDVPGESRLLIALSMAANEALARTQGRKRETWEQEVQQVGAVLRSQPQQVEERLEELLAMRAAA